MDDKVKFQAALAALQSRAEEHGGVLNIEEMQDYLKDMEFSQEQLGMISAYLTGKGIHVEGAALPEEEKKPYTEEEEEFLAQYRKELKAARRQPEEQLALLWQQVQEGEQKARELLAEHYMDKVLAVAEEYAHQGMLIQDLVQEGSLGLLTGLNSFGQQPEEPGDEKYLEREIRKGIRQAMEEQKSERSVGEEVTGKLNRLADSITELTEDLGRQITPDELSVYLEMPLEEIEDLLRIAGDTIEMADADGRKES